MADFYFDHGHSLRESQREESQRENHANPPSNLAFRLMKHRSLKDPRWLTDKVACGGTNARYLKLHFHNSRSDDGGLS